MDHPLATRGFLHLQGPFEAPQDAWRTAATLVAEAEPARPLAVLGDFLIPPPDGPPSRDFQTLHLDFGLPLRPVAPADVARFTALHIAPRTAPSDAVTRLVPIAALAEAREWADREELVRRFAAYGRTHGAWDDEDGYIEGSFARIFEAALGGPAALPSVKEDPGFLCGTEFDSLAAEHRFFRDRRLDLAPLEVEVPLGPGELLVFDNLSLAHGRRGRRRPGELHQRVLGHPSLPAEEQLRLRDRLLDLLSPTRVEAVPAAQGIL
jgi:hypothetical protein